MELNLYPRKSEFDEYEQQYYDFIHYIQRIVPKVNEAQLGKILSLCSIQNIAPKQTILPPPEYVGNQFFIRNGICRMYKANNGLEHTFRFFVQGEFVGNAQSSFLEFGTDFTLESLSSMCIIRLNHEAYTLDEDVQNIWNQINRRIYERSFIYNRSRFIELQSSTLKERYLNLINTHPDLFMQVPLQHIASFLSVKPQSLSRIRANI